VSKKRAKPIIEEKKPVKKVKLVKKGRTTELKMEPHANFNEDITNILEQMGVNEKNSGNGVKVGTLHP
jgi:hypothetical protein